MKGRYDLIVIGGGTAGLVSAAGAASLGAKVALAERDRLGGDCLYRGCVPTKTLIKSARIAHLMVRSEEYGIKSSGYEIDFPAVMVIPEVLVAPICAMLLSAPQQNNEERAP